MVSGSDSAACSAGRVYVLYTGGTIGMAPEEPGKPGSPLVPKPLEDLKEYMPGLENLGIVLGEGSFDKGIFFEIPFSWLGGVPTRRGFATAIRPVQRDGGARVFVRNRLYDSVSEFQDPELRERWARYWR